MLKHQNHEFVFMQRYNNKSRDSYKCKKCDIFVYYDEFNPFSKFSFPITYGVPLNIKKLTCEEYIIKKFLE